MIWVLYVFHTLPKNPCCDGLLATILQCLLDPKAQKLIFPYSRTRESFEKLKHFLLIVQELAQEESAQVKVVYLDISPEFEEEIDILENLVQSSVQVEVKDHHPSKHAKRLQTSKFRYVFDSVRCAAKMVADELEHNMEDTWIKQAVSLIQYSEYEGQDKELAGESQALRISACIQTQDAGHSDAQEHLDLKDVLYYILDFIMPKDKGCEFLYSASVTTLEEAKSFTAKFQVYIEAYRNLLESTVTGKNRDLFTATRIQEALQKKREAEHILQMAPLARVELEDGAQNVLFADISIVHYGRSLEPVLRRILHARRANYAVLVNPPNKGAYYLSLRRATGQQDARRLVKYVLQQSGSVIGGGHPWASGANLSTSQYQQLLAVIDLDPEAAGQGRHE